MSGAVPVVQPPAPAFRPYHDGADFRKSVLTQLFTAVLALSLFSAEADFQTQFVSGLRALNRQDFPAAKTALLAASRLQPSNPRVWVALAQTYRKLKETTLAAAAAGKAERLGQEDPVALRTLATYYSEQGKFYKAGDLEVRCAAKDSNDPSAVTRAMSDYLQADQPKRAIDLALATVGWEHRADIRDLLGKSYEADGQILKTIPELREAVQLKPDDESYYFDLMQALLSHFNFDIAIRIGEEGRRRFPRSAQIALATGVAYYGGWQPEAAADAFLDTIAVDPAVEQPYLFLLRLISDAHRRLPSRMPEIEHRFVEYQEKNPGNYLGYFLHAKALSAQSKEPEQAESLLRKSIALNGKYWESHYDLGLLLTKRHALVEAEKELRRSTELNPNNPVAHYHLFRVLASLGRTEAAQAELAVQRRVYAEYEAYMNQQTGEVKRLDMTLTDTAKPNRPQQ
jgi:tetratricopeptide (TPR) repeat protein